MTLKLAKMNIDALQHLLSSYRLSRLQVSTPREWTWMIADATIASALARRVGSWQLVEWLQVQQKWEVESQRAAEYASALAVPGALYTLPAALETHVDDE